MRAVVQRTKRAKVTSGGKVLGEIGEGLTVLAGIAKGDTETDAQWMARKVAGLRIFEDENGKMNLSVLERGGSILAVSQFTLLAESSKGLRPSFSEAEEPEEALRLFGLFVGMLKNLCPIVQTGEFRQAMEVELVNDGPVTIILDSKNK